MKYIKILHADSLLFNTCLANAECRSLRIHPILFRSLAFRIQSLPTIWIRSSIYLVGWLPTLQRPVRGFHSRTFVPHRLSVRWHIGLAHFHFFQAITLALPVKPVLRISVLCILYLREMPNIAHSILSRTAEFIDNAFPEVFFATYHTVME